MKSWLPVSIQKLGAERRLKAGQTLFRQGSRSASLFEVVSGKVRLVRADSAGREAVVYVAAAGDPLAEASLFSATYHCDAIATTNARRSRFRLSIDSATSAEELLRGWSSQPFVA